MREKGFMGDIQKEIKEYSQNIFLTLKYKYDDGLNNAVSAKISQFYNPHSQNA